MDDAVVETISVLDMATGKSGYVCEQAICLDGSGQGWVYKEAPVIDRSANPFRIEIVRTDRGVVVHLQKSEQADTMGFALCELTPDDRFSIQGFVSK